MSKPDTKGEIEMKARKIKQHQLVLMKRHAFKRMCARYIAASRLRRAQQLATELVDLPVEGLFVLEPLNWQDTPEIDAGGYTARNWRDDSFWGETK